MIDSASKNEVVFHLQVDNGESPIRDIRAAYSTNNFNVEPQVVQYGFFEVSTFMPRMLPPRGTLSIPGREKEIFTRDQQTTLTVMIGFRAEISATTSKDFTTISRFVVRPEDVRPQVIHPEGIETTEQAFNDETMQSRLTAQGFLLTSGTFSFDVEETRDNGEPNIVRDENEFRRFRFDPITRLVTFQMKTSSGKLITLELPLPLRKDKPHRVSLAWDYSKGGYLILDGIVTENLNGVARTVKLPAPTRESN